MLKRILIFYSILILNCNPVYAWRPFYTEDATVANKGAFEFEIGATYVREDNRDNKYSFSLVPIYGFTRNLEVSLEFPFNVIRPEEEPDEKGFGDMAIVLKALLSPETERIPSFLLKTIIKLSTGDEDKGLGSGDEDVGLVLAATKTIGPVSMHGNIGYTFVGKEFDDTLKDYLLYGVALEYAINPELSVVGEIYGESDSHFDIGTFEHHSINPLLGLTYKLTKKITLDTAFRTGFPYNKKTDYSIITGLSIKF